MRFAGVSTRMAYCRRCTVTVHGCTSDGQSNCEGGRKSRTPRWMVVGVDGKTIAKALEQMCSILLVDADPVDRPDARLSRFANRSRPFFRREPLVRQLRVATSFLTSTKLRRS